MLLENPAGWSCLALEILAYALAKVCDCSHCEMRGHAFSWTVRTGLRLYRYNSKLDICTCGPIVVLLSVNPRRLDRAMADQWRCAPRSLRSVLSQLLENLPAKREDQRRQSSNRIGLKKRCHITLSWIGDKRLRAILQATDAGVLKPADARRRKPNAPSPRSPAGAPGLLSSGFTKTRISRKTRTRSLFCQR